MQNRREHIHCTLTYINNRPKTKNVRIQYVIKPVFRCFRKITKNNCYLHHNCLSICLTMSVRPSVRMQQFSSHWTDFREIWFPKFFENQWRKFVFHYNLTIIMGTLHEGLCKFISRRVLLRLRYILDKRCRGNQNTHFMLNSFFPKIAPFVR